MATRKKVQTVIEDEPVVISDEIAEKVKQNEAYLQEMVEIELFYDGDKYKDDVVVNCNGKNWIIKRGQKVTVPRYIAQIIQDSAAQDKNAAMYSAGLAEAFENDSKKNGVEL